MFGFGAISDPFNLPGDAGLFGFRNASGKTVRDPRIVPGEATAVFLAGGQSNGANFASEQYVVANGGKVDQISIYDGGCYAYSDVPLGSDGTGGSIWGRLADKLITEGKYKRVIFIPYAIGGTISGLWVPGGALHPRIIVAVRRAAALGLPITASLWQHGETDGQYATTQAAYQSAMQAIRAAVVAEGVTAPWLLAKSTLIANVQSATIRAAVTALVDGTNFKAGPDTDTLTGTGNRYDGTHFTGAGANAAANLWRDAILTGL